MKIPFNKPFIAGKELYYIAQAVQAGHLAGDGLYTKKCHQWFEQHLDCRKVMLTHSCTAALEMAAILCDIQPGDEVIMPSFTFVSTANAFVLRGGRPVFVDIRPDTLNINEQLIDRAITPRTRAIVPVHYAGVPCAMNEVMDIAKRHQLLVVEDTAHALLSKHENRFVGTIGHLGCVSFHETKNIISGEGGALFINDDRFIEKAEIIRDKGTNRAKFFKGDVDRYTWVDIGSSFLPSELIGAFLYAQLEQAEQIVARRSKICRSYYECLKPLREREFIRLPYSSEDCMNNGHIFYIITRSREERSELIAYLKERAILALFHYVPLHSSPAGMKYGIVSGKMTITDDISEKILRLPMYYEMNDREIDRVVRAVEGFYLARS
jgi:dTDP-4-amino-4,6-dideoxygalactose transaminase